jgi:hypothetical protein|tara:strand:+ start:808 stop:933 length:126 start_codon:yes stop_codon:yes gene_type:complete
MEDIIWIECIQDENTNEGGTKGQNKDKIDLVFLYDFIGLFK